MTPAARTLLLALIQPLTRDEAQAAIGVAPGAALLELVDGGLIERVVVAGQPDRFQRTDAGETRALVEDEPVEEPAPPADGLRVTARTEEGGDPSGRVSERRGRGPGKAAGELAALRQGLVEAMGLSAPEADGTLLARVCALVADEQAARLTLAGMRAGLADEPAALPEGWARACYRETDGHHAEVSGGHWGVTGRQPNGVVRPKPEQAGTCADESEGIRLADAVLRVLAGG